MCGGCKPAGDGWVLWRGGWRRREGFWRGRGSGMALAMAGGRLGMVGERGVLRRGEAAPSCGTPSGYSPVWMGGRGECIQAEGEMAALIMGIRSSPHSDQSPSPRGIPWAFGENEWDIGSLSRGVLGGTLIRVCGEVTYLRRMSCGMDRWMLGLRSGGSGIY